jgi:hypothetical protein
MISQKHFVKAISKVREKNKEKAYESAGKMFV